VGLVYDSRELPGVTTVRLGVAEVLQRVSRFGPQNWQLRFGDLGIKITVTVSLFVPQNYEGYGLSVAPQNR
jgi:hypothetical protein